MNAPDWRAAAGARDSVGRRAAARDSRRRVRIIGAACGRGALDPRCEAGPEALRAQLLRRLRADGASARWQGTLRPGASTRRTAAAVVSGLCRRLAGKVARSASRGELAVVLGGDHSCALGTWSGMRAALDGPLGLIWVDAHLDAHTPATSPSGALHGMPLACLLGHGEPPLVDAAAPPALLPEHVCVIGARSFERAEAQLLERLGVRVFGMEELSRRGLASVLHEALQITQAGTAGFGLTIDLDAIDPRDAPGVSTPAPGGLRAAELVDALRILNGHAKLAALELAELNPELDRGGMTARLAVELVAAVASPLPDAVALERRYCARNYAPTPLVLVKGEGAWLWDDRGRKYLDMLSAYSAVSHGHAHPRLARALAKQARKVAVFKAARKWAYLVKGVPRDKAEIIACEGNFHGRTSTIVGMSSIERYREGFGPFAPGSRLIPYGDAAALEAAIGPNTAAFLVEPIQGEGGIVVPPQGYLAACARICARHRVLLVCDEVQTGLGRTGKLLACEHEGVVPDALILGKALGGGLLPVSAFLASREVMQVFSPGDHGSTFGGNALACAVALEALDVLLEERLIERSAAMGAYLLGALKELESPLIREARGRGLLVGIEFDPALASAKAICEGLLEQGVITKETRDTVIRFAPPLVISREQIDWAVGRLRAVLERCAATTPASRAAAPPPSAEPPEATGRACA